MSKTVVFVARTFSDHAQSCSTNIYVRHSLLAMVCRNGAPKTQISGSGELSCLDGNNMCITPQHDRQNRGVNIGTIDAHGTQQHTSVMSHCQSAVICRAVGYIRSADTTDFIVPRTRTSSRRERFVSLDRLFGTLFLSLFDQ